MFRSLWPQSLFWRLIAATVLGVLLAQGASLYLLARNEARDVEQVTTRMWAHRISEITLLAAELPAPQRAAFLNRLIARTGPGGAAVLSGGPVMLLRGGIGAFGLLRRPIPAGVAAQRTGKITLATGAMGAGAGSQPGLVVAFRLPRSRALARRDGARSRGLRVWQSFAPHGLIPSAVSIPLPFASHSDALLVRRVREDLGPRYAVAVSHHTDANARAIRLPPFMGPVSRSEGLYDVRVTAPGQPPLTFRLARIAPRLALPPRLLLNLVLLVAVLVAALYFATRGITRPLSGLARAAEAMGRGVRSPQLPEEGPRELRFAARAFNTMQERLHRYLDSRTVVLAAMSHDLKTPLTRLRLQVETLIEDTAVRARLDGELDEMETMVHGALALFRGLDEADSPEPIDMNALLDALRQGFLDMGHEVSVTGRADAPYYGKPQALKRCLTNLVSNAVKFGVRARIEVHDGAALRILVSDDGPGVPPEALERVFEPFYRLEGSRNRDTGGTGLGLSIARDVAQAHGGTVLLKNRSEGGLTAELHLPRRSHPRS